MLSLIHYISIIWEASWQQRILSAADHAFRSFNCLWRSMRLGDESPAAGGGLRLSPHCSLSFPRLGTNTLPSLKMLQQNPLQKLPMGHLINAKKMNNAHLINANRVNNAHRCGPCSALQHVLHGLSQGWLLHQHCTTLCLEGCKATEQHQGPSVRAGAKQLLATLEMWKSEPGDSSYLLHTQGEGLVLHKLCHFLGLHQALSLCNTHHLCSTLQFLDSRW